MAHLPVVEIWDPSGNFIPLRDRIRRFLVEAPSHPLLGYRPRDIFPNVARRGQSRTAMYRMLSRMVEQGQLARSPGGTYTVTNQGERG